MARKISSVAEEPRGEDDVNQADAQRDIKGQVRLADEYATASTPWPMNQP